MRCRELDIGTERGVAFFFFFFQFSVRSKVRRERERERETCLPRRMQMVPETSYTRL